MIEEKSSTEKSLYDAQLTNRELSIKLAEIKMKCDEKEYESRKLKEKLEEKTKEINQFSEKLKTTQEKLSTESQLLKGIEEKKDLKLQMIEKELLEIKKILALKEVFYITCYSEFEK